jgi:hypothetical protein
VDPIYLELELDADAAPSSVDAERRVIEGSVLPFGELGVATVDGEPRRLRYIAGEHVPLRERIPLVLGHDTERPVGVLAELRSSDAELSARFSIDATPDGDAALVQASSGSRAGLSAGMLATAYRDLEDGTLEVSGSTIVHVGLCSMPAFEGAAVSRVAAARPVQVPTTQGGSAMEPTPTPTPDPPVQGHITPADAPTIPVAAAAPADPPEVPVILSATPRARDLAAGDGARFVQAMLRAQTGDRDAVAYVEAVLAEVATADIPGIVPPAYTTEILGEIEIERVLAERVAVRRPMPDTGMKITKPRWTTLPNGGWVAELAEIPSNKPEIDPEDVTILEWAYGVALSYAATVRSSPDALDAIFRAAVQDYYSDVEQKIADALLAEDTPSAAGASLGAGVSASFTATRKRPNVLLVSADVYGDLFDDIVMMPVVAGADGIDARMGGFVGGLEVVASAHLPAGTEIVTRRGVIELRETDPVRLTANAIGALKVELGVTAFASFDVEEPGGIISLTPAAGAPAGESAARKSARARKSSK